MPSSSFQSVNNLRSCSVSPSLFSSSSSSFQEQKASEYPVHVAVVMDGNRRWAINRALRVEDGYEKGVQALKTLVNACYEKRIKVLTVFAFSMDNWKRNAMEISFLMKLFERCLLEEVEELNRQGVCLKFIVSLLESRSFMKIIHISTFLLLHYSSDMITSSIILE